MNDVFMVRHGENPANLTKEFSCLKVDYSLTEKGRIQAQQTGESLVKEQIDVLYCSPLIRARETAEIIGQYIGRTPIIVEEFRELNVGRLELEPPTAENWRVHNEIFMGWLKGQPDLRFPDGEDYHNLLVRTRRAYENIIEGRNQQRIVVVGHGGQLMVTIKDICQNVTWQKLMGQDVHNCAITHIRLGKEDGKLLGELVRWGDSSHLHGEAANVVKSYPTEEEHRLMQLRQPE
jgi:probable phosphoglycerate mutase